MARSGKAVDLLGGLIGEEGGGCFDLFLRRPLERFLLVKGCGRVDVIFLNKGVVVGCKDLPLIGLNSFLLLYWSFHCLFWWRF